MNTNPLSTLVWSKPFASKHEFHPHPFHLDLVTRIANAFGMSLHHLCWSFLCSLARCIRRRKLHSSICVRDTSFLEVAVGSWITYKLILDLDQEVHAKPKLPFSWSHAKNELALNSSIDSKLRLIEARIDQSLSTWGKSSPTTMTHDSCVLIHVCFRIVGWLKSYSSQCLACTPSGCIISFRWRGPRLVDFPSGIEVIEASDTSKLQLVQEDNMATKR